MAEYSNKHSMSDSKIEFEQLLVDYPILMEQFIGNGFAFSEELLQDCLLYTSPSPRDA